VRSSKGGAQKTNLKRAIRKAAIKLANPTDARRRDLDSKAFSNHYADVRRHTPARTIRTDKTYNDNQY